MDEGPGYGAVVVVPAHNEETVIGRCLRTLLREAAPGEVTILVVSNGSTDRTAAVAREIAEERGEGIEVVELAEPSKIGAIREGMRLARDRAVVVLDADIEMSTATLRGLVAAVDVPGAVVASPRVRMITADSSWLVRGYYRVWMSLPYVSAGMIGSGVFALSAAAIAGLGTLPDVTNDDGWVRRSFDEEHRVVLDEEFTARAALTAGALVARRARIINGNREIDARLGSDDPGGNSTGALLALLRARRVRIGDAAAFLVVTVASRLSALLRRIRRDRSWSTDRTTRGAPGR